MRGHVRQHKENVWHLVFDLPRDADGKRRQKWLTVHGTRERAEGVLAQILADLYREEYVEPSEILLEDWLKQWLVMKHPPAVGQRTWESYEAECENKIIPGIGHLSLAKLKPLHIQGLYADLLNTPRKGRRKGTLSPNTVRYTHRVLHAALEDAVKLGVIRINPAGSVIIPKKQRKEQLFLDLDDARKLLRVSMGTRYHAPIALALLCGMRRSEILGLRWRDINWDRLSLTVQQTIVASQEKGTIKQATTKTDGSQRSIRFSPVVATALKKHKAIQSEERLRAGAEWEDNDLFFANAKGGPAYPDTLSNGYKRIVEKYGLKYVRFHDLRHSQASLLLARGIQMKVISDRLGHSGIGITADLYSHLTDELQAEAASALDDLMPYA